MEDAVGHSMNTSDETQATQVVIIGAGQGGYQAAASLRDEGFAGTIHLIGDEPGLPYQRPPLSKAFLTGEVTAANLALRQETFFTDKKIETHFGVRALEVDRATRRVRLSDGTSLAYGHLIFATGSRNIRLPIPGMDLPGVVQLRSLSDAEDILRQIDQAKRVVVIGAGFIGLEFAAFTIERGLPTSVLEAAERPMARALSRVMSQHFQDSHISAGVVFEFGAQAIRIVEESGRAIGVETADGRIFEGDLILVGVGVRPNVELAAEAGLRIENGILVDAQMTTSDPFISALGDCAAYPSVYAGGDIVRIESVQNAVDHARCIAARIVGKPAPYKAVPWFWSDQGKLKLQIAGLTSPHTQTVLRGDPTSGSFSVFCFNGDQLAGVESVNRPADHMASRKILLAGLPLTPAQAADLTVDLKAMVTPPRPARQGP